MPTPARPIRILLIHQFFLEKGDGGGSRFNEMARHWAEAGAEVTVLAGMVHYNTGKKPDKYRRKWVVQEDYSPGVTVLRCHVSESYNKSFAGRLWGYFSFVFSSLYAGLFRLETGFDVVLVTSPPLFVGITGALLARFRQKPLLFEIRDLWPESAIDTGVLTNPLIIRLAYAFEKWIYTEASRINVLTPAFRKKLEADKGIPPEKIVDIPNAADFSIAQAVQQDFDRDAFRRKLGWAGQFVALYVGAHGVANSLIQLIETAELLRDEPIRIVMIGEGMERKMLLDEVQKRGLETKVQMLPPVSKQEVFRYILGADAGVSVLKNVETFKTVYSNKTFDYMACSRPVVLGIDGVSRELVETARCGTFAEPENARAIAEVLRSYARNPALAQEHGRNGNAYALQNFDRNTLAARYLGHLLELANPQDQ